MRRSSILFFSPAFLVSTLLPSCFTNADRSPHTQAAAARERPAVLEGGGSPHQVEDELRLLRQLAPALRAELAASGKPGGDPVFVFAAIEDYEAKQWGQEGQFRKR
jgi:hypothetical protein